jgi:hypothetical protein
MLQVSNFLRNLIIFLLIIPVSTYLPQKVPGPANAHNLQKGFYEVPVNSKSVICSFPTVTTPLGFRKIPEALNPKLLRWVT